MKKSLLILTFFITFPFTVSAGTMGMLNDIGNKSGFNPDTNATTMSSVVGIVISAFLSLLGVLFVSLIVYGGYLWMTDAGNSEQMQKAKQLISRAIIGLIITISAWAAWGFIFKKIILGG